MDVREEAHWKYQESIIALMGAVGLGRDYLKELDFASPGPADIILDVRPVQLYSFHLWPPGIFPELLR